MNQNINDKGKKNLIPIALSTDNNYTFPTIVAITSILENASASTYYDIYILLSGDFKKENKNRLLKIKDKYDRCNITLIDMKNEFKSINITRHIFAPSISTPTYYRLKLASILGHLSKVLYLDVDTIILNDLLELYNTNIESYYLAGVIDLDIAIISGNNYTNNIGVKDSSKYINAGVLLINLEKIRNEGIEKTFENFIIKNIGNKDWKWHDQDVLNSVCYGMIYYLPYKFNVMSHQYSQVQIYKLLRLKKSYTKSFNQSFRNPQIIHYSGTKPWVILTNKFSTIWWNYAKKSIASDEIKQTYKLPYLLTKLLPNKIKSSN